MTAEKYLRTIYRLTDGGDGNTTTSEVATAMDVSDASVTETVEKLEDENLVCRVPYKGFTLSPMGKSKAEELDSKREAVENFFSEVLELEKPGEEAGRVVDSISKDAANRMREFVD